MPPLLRPRFDAIHRGNVEALKRPLDANPALTTARIDGSRTLLHIATDWPGHFPNVAATIAELVDHGAEVNALYRQARRNSLHWAASGDDVAALDALLDHGADIEASGAVLAAAHPWPMRWLSVSGRTRRLVERRAQINLWLAAGLDLMSRVEQHFARGAAPSPDEVTNAFWCACAGGQRAAAEYLLACGANWIGYNRQTSFDAATRSRATEVVERLSKVGVEVGERGGLTSVMWRLGVGVLRQTQVWRPVPRGALDSFQGLFEVGQEVAPVFDAD